MWSVRAACCNELSALMNFLSHGAMRSLLSPTRCRLYSRAPLRHALQGDRGGFSLYMQPRADLPTRDGAALRALFASDALTRLHRQQGLDSRLSTSGSSERAIHVLAGGPRARLVESHGREHASHACGDADAIIAVRINRAAVHCRAFTHATVRREGAYSPLGQECRLTARGALDASRVA